MRLRSNLENDIGRPWLLVYFLVIIIPLVLCLMSYFWEIVGMVTGKYRDEEEDEEDEEEEGEEEGEEGEAGAAEGANSATN